MNLGVRMSAFDPSADVESAPSEATDSATATPLNSLSELDTLAGRDVEEHPDVYQRIHTDLQGALASIDDA